MFFIGASGGTGTDEQKEVVMIRKLVGAIIGLGLGLPNFMFALGMGDVQLKSYLNQPLNAKIELVQARGLSPSEIIVGLASTKEFSAAGVDRSFFLTQLKFQVRQEEDGKLFLLVSSKGPVTEPFLNLLVEVQWPSGRLLREYTLLLDPPEFKNELPLAISAPSARKNLPLPPSNGPQPPFVKEPGTTASAGRSQSELVIPPPNPVKTAGQINQSNAAVASQSLGKKPAILPQPEAQSASKSQTPPAATTRMSQASAPTLGTTSHAGSLYEVKAGDTLAAIIKETNVQSGASLAQALMAYQYLNPEAFIDNNVNLVRKGAMLKVPSQDDVKKMNRREAWAKVHEQNQAWRAKILARSGKQADGLSQRQIDGSGQVKASNRQRSIEDDGHLSIATASETQDTEKNLDTGSGKSGATRGSGSGLEHQLALQTEQIEKHKIMQENLTTELADLNELVNKTDRVLTLKNNKIVALQAQMEALRQQTDQSQASGQDLTEQTTQQAQAEESSTQSPNTLPGDEVQPDEQSANAQSAQMQSANGEESADQTQQPAQTSDPQASLQEANQEKAESFDDALMEKSETGASWLEHYAKNPLVLAGAGLAASVILLLIWFQKRRRAQAVDEDDFDDALDDQVESASERLSSLKAHENDRQLVEAKDDFDLDTVLSEADIYIAYGHFAKAIKMLEDGIQTSPNAVNLYLKLMEVYAESKNVQEFERVEAQLRSIQRDAATLEQIQQLRREAGFAAVSAPVAPGAKSSIKPSEKTTAKSIAETRHGFEEEETQFIGEESPKNTDDEEFLSLADIEAELDVGLKPEPSTAAQSKAPSSSTKTPPASKAPKTPQPQPTVKSSSGLSTNQSPELEGLDLDFSEEITLDKTFHSELAPGGQGTANAKPGTGTKTSKQVSFDEEETGLGPLFVEPMPTYESQLKAESTQSSLEDELDFSLDESLADIDKALGQFDNNDLNTRRDAQKTPERSTGQQQDLSVDFTEDLSEIDLGLLNIAQNTEKSAGLGTAKNAFQGMDLDLSEEGLTPAPAQPAALNQSANRIQSESFGLEDQDLSLLDGVDEVGTKLDLAKAYVDMGDQEGAKEILDEVLLEGSEDQQEQARLMLSKLKISPA